MDDGGEVRIPKCHLPELTDFFAAHDRWLFGHACARTRGDREAAADLAQDTFEAAARSWSTLREHSGRRQRAWLLSTLVHKDISDFRHQQVFRRRQPDIHARYQPTAADTEAQALNAIALARAREIIKVMPPRQREIALLRWQDHLRVTEIADRLGDDDGADGLREYVAQISRIPELTAGEEARLARRVQAGRRAEEGLAEGGGLAGAERTELEWAAQEGARAGNLLLEANLRLVVALAKRFTGRGVRFPDLVQEGNLGLIRAVQEYDPAKGYPFASYATWWIRRALSRAVQGEAHATAVPRSAAHGIGGLIRAEQRTARALGREPTAEEIAAEL